MSQSDPNKVLAAEERSQETKSFVRRVRSITRRRYTPVGGDVTPQSELRYPGAMLYEMVRGGPRFLGDDIVAIIGQHINIGPGPYAVMQHRGR